MDDRNWIWTVHRFQSSLKRLNKEEFDNFLYQVHINGKSDVLSQVLTSKKKKNRYLRLLDSCYKNAEAGKSSCSQVEQEFLKKIPQEALPDLIAEEAKKYGVKVTISSNYGYRVKIMNDLKQMLERGDRDGFERYAMNKLMGFNGIFGCKVDFINLLVDDPKYAYCWTKFIMLKRRIPDFVKAVKKLYKADAEAFIRRMNGDPLPIPPLESEKSEMCQVFGKSYKLITVTTATELQDFINTYFVRLKPDILGVDVESVPIVNQVALLQLATKDWCCIVDVHLLSKQLDESDWKKLFDRIFDPAITRVAFAFASDYYLLGNTFDFLKPLMQNVKSKGLCIKKLVEGILKNAQADGLIFDDQKLSSVSLNNVTEAILGIKLHKDMQLSDWSRRPLSKDQKLYAVTDAIVVLLIKDKIETTLKRYMSSTSALKIFEDGYVSMKREKDGTTIDGLTKTFGKVSI